MNSDHWKRSIQWRKGLNRYNTRKLTENNRNQATPARPKSNCVPEFPTAGRRSEGNLISQSQIPIRVARVPQFRQVKWLFNLPGGWNKVSTIECSIVVANLSPVLDGAENCKISRLVLSNVTWKILNICGLKHGTRKHR